MRTIYGIILLVALGPQIFAQQVNMSGIWTGKLALPNSMELTIVFNLSKNDSGIYLSLIHI